LHFEREVERNVASGLAPDEARVAAQRMFGNIAVHREHTRDAAGARTLEHVAQDVRYAVRTLRRTPGYAIVVFTSVALGIGANVAIFSVADTLLLRPLAVRDPSRLVTVEQTLSDGFRQPNFAFSDYERFKGNTNVFAGMTATTWADGFNVITSWPDGGVGTSQDHISIVTGNFFTMLGVTAARGRVFTDDDDRTLGAHPVAVISDAYWARRFDRAPDVLGRTLTVNGTKLHIIGVTPRAFTGDWIGWPTDFWVPVAMQADVMTGTNRTRRGGFAQFKLLGRLQPNVTPEHARDAIQRVHDDIAAEKVRGSGVVADARVEVTSAERGYSPQRDTFAKPIAILTGLVAAILLITCANVAGLSLARATARRREIAMRMAIGATRRRVTRQLLTESVLLALGGSVGGIVLGLLGMRVLAELISSGPVSSVSLGSASLALDLHLDARVMTFAIVVSVLAVLLFGLMPAFRGSRVSLQSVLARRADGGTHGVAARRALVVVQVALSLVLLTGASIFVQTLRNLRNEDIGADSGRLVMAWTLPGLTDLQGNRLRSLVASVHHRVAAIPGVASVSESGTGLLTGSSGGPRVWADRVTSNDNESIVVDGSMTAGAGFFETIGQPVLYGREFTSQDTDTSARVVIVNQSLARRLFGVDNALGRRLSTRSEGGSTSYEIIGVVKDARYRNPRQAAGLMTYWPLFNSGRAPRVTFIIRAAGNVPSLIPAIRREIQLAEPSLPVLNVDTVEGQLDGLLFRERLTATFSLFFGVLALVLATVGLSGVVSYTAARRTHEIGIRVALGAPRTGVLGMIVGESVRLVILGVVVGVPLAVMLQRWAASLAYGVRVDRLDTPVLAAAVLTAVAIVAALLPAHRASRVDPAIALRVE
jgi:predicted permease